MRLTAFCRGGLASLALTMMVAGRVAADDGEVVTVADAAPSSEAVERLCMSHGRQCPCPGCRAYYGACDDACPPLPSVLPEQDVARGASQLPATLDDGAPAAGPSGAMSGPMPSMTSSLGAIAQSTSASPGMIGDFFGGGYQYLVASPLNGATVAVAGGDRVMKFSDNNNPIPQNRLFFNYHLFSNPVTDVNGVSQDVNRFTFGLEKTFWDSTASIEFRVPFEAAVDSSQTLGQTTDTLGAEFGNLALALKMLIYDNSHWTVSGGLGMIFPTANDATIYSLPQEPIVTFANESYFLQPFLGVYFKPNSRLFTQFVTQVNFDVSGSTVTVSDSSVFGGSGSDRVFEQPLLFLDSSLGYWLYQTKRHDVWITGIAPMIELHYSSTLKDLDLPDIGSGVFEPDFRRDALNLTGGVLFSLGRWTSLRVAGVAPLRHESLMYDAELGVQLIRRY
jgi:hypothetical protein